MAFDLKKIVGSVAPWLATALGGPLSGQAVSAITSALGLPAGSSQADLEKAISQGQLTGDNIVALKQAELQFQQSMQAAGFENEQKLAEIAEQDRDSARKREMTVLDWTPRILAYAVIGASIALAWSIVTGHADMKNPTQATLVGTVLGYLFGEAKQILAYYYGSSSGSDRKTELLAQSSPADGILTAAKRS